MLDDGTRKNLADLFNVSEDFFDIFSDDAVCFLSYEKRRRLEFSFERNKPKIIFKRKLIKDYFDTTGYKSSVYKVKSGRLYLTLNRLEDYVSKKKIN
jgi:hypothetical protein